MIKQTLSNVIVATLFTLAPVNFVSQTVEKPQQVANSTVNTTARTVEEVRSKSEEAVNRGASDTTPAAENRNDRANEAKAAANERKTGTTDSLQAEQKPLNPSQLKKCERAEGSISSAINQIQNRGSKQLEVFKTISDRTKSFYTTRGYSAENYQGAISELNRLYDEALTALIATQNSGDSWDCRGDNPVKQIAQLRATKQAEITALTAYKNKVQELIVIVKTAATKEAQ